MPQYIGFSTQQACQPKDTNPLLNGLSNPYGLPNGYGFSGWGGKFTLYDEQLVVQDLINALNIQIGSKVGQPGYGTTLWSFIFEPNTPDVQAACEAEIRRVSSQDPRLLVNSVNAFPQENGLLIEVQLSVTPFNQALNVGVYASQQTGTASITSVSAASGIMPGL